MDLYTNCFSYSVYLYKSIKELKIRKNSIWFVIFFLPYGQKVNLCQLFTHQIRTNLNCSFMESFIFLKSSLTHKQFGKNNHSTNFVYSILVSCRTLIAFSIFVAFSLHFPSLTRNLKCIYIGFKSTSTSSCCCCAIFPFREINARATGRIIDIAFVVINNYAAR